MYKFYYSLTILPERAESLEINLSSLLNQTVQPEGIIVNIPKKYSLRFGDVVMPEECINRMKSLNNLIQINMLEEDYGPGTKLVGFSKWYEANCKEDEVKEDKYKTFVVLVDDDVVYNKKMIENYYFNLNKIDYDAMCFYTYKIYYLTVGQGVDGLAINVKLLKKFIDFYKMISVFKSIKYHDDLYISYFIYLLNKHIHPIKMKVEDGMLYEGINYDHDQNLIRNRLSNLKGNNSRISLTLSGFYFLDTLRKKGLYKNIGL